MKPFEKCSILKEVNTYCTNSTAPIREGSCWLIEFMDGYKIIVSEEFYRQEQARNWAGRPRLSEQHWFDFRKCRERNRGVGIYGFY